ncbi:MAG: hypothetical protein D6702_00345 [Planctomycetota bacterium]|nr:MAG: hypothetical protein D6702_00345 [Planctomycetota bacterium]
MIRILLLLAVGVASWPLWPPPWRTGLLLGWSLALALELSLFALRRGAAARSGFRPLLQVQVFGFLLKLVVLTLGGVLGARTGWYHHPSFLLAFVAGIVAGEAVALTALLRARPLRSRLRRGDERGSPSA